MHGDFYMVDGDGSWYVLGRSDNTIKVAGKCLGPAEIKSVAVHHPQVVEAAAIGIPHEVKGSEVLLLCVLTPGIEHGENLRAEIRNMIAASMGKALSPKKILFVQDLPKTRNAKVMRRMIRAAYLGLDPGDTSSLVNPEALQDVRAAE